MSSKTGEHTFKLTIAERCAFWLDLYWFGIKISLEMIRIKGHWTFCSNEMLTEASSYPLTKTAKIFCDPNCLSDTFNFDDTDYLSFWLRNYNCSHISKRKILSSYSKSLLSFLHWTFLDLISQNDFYHDNRNAFCLVL